MWHPSSSPFTSHIFSETLSSGDDNDQDEDLQKDRNKDKDTDRQGQIQSAYKTQNMLFFSKAGVQGFKILYWLSSCDDKDNDSILYISRCEYYSGVNVFQG